MSTPVKRSWEYTHQQKEEQTMNNTETIGGLYVGEKGDRREGKEKTREGNHRTP
jgi:hypothetical protein